MKFYPKTSLLFTLTFILMTVIGTLSHEGGHYAVARMLGYESRINYQKAFSHNPLLEKRIDSLGKWYAQQPDGAAPSVLENEFFALRERHFRNHFFITLGGPIQTILTGTIGFVLLLVYRRRLFNKTQVKPMGWVLIFLSLFWLRQLANLAVGVAFLLLRGKTSGRDDESVISYLFGLPQWTILIVTGVFSAGVLLYILHVLPQRLRLTFMLSGLVGGVLGYYLWLEKFGKVIMP